MPLGQQRIFFPSVKQEYVGQCSPARFRFEEARLSDRVLALSGRARFRVRPSAVVLNNGGSSKDVADVFWDDDLYIVGARESHLYRDVQSWVGPFQEYLDIATPTENCW